MKILKTKQGFTLIELLVVIGILAVLAAIAIPSVAGLIDRANVSADATNANEMTNAIERFTSEYELYLQDIASDRLDTANLDSAQGRVYNVTGVTDRAGIEALEKDATAGVDTTGKAIYRDTKYPVNAETMQAVVENYMKTSSSTFTPKQSDCHYYYSPDCGLVVCTETEKSDVTDLNALVQSGKDAKGKDLSATTKWIDLTDSISLSGDSNTPAANDGKIEYGMNDPDLNHNGIIPEGGIYLTGVSFDGFYWSYTTKLSSGEEFPTTINNYDIYIYEDYVYMRGISSAYFGRDGAGCPFELQVEGLGTIVGLNPGGAVNGWTVGLNGTRFTGDLKTQFGNILEYINNQPVTSLSTTFYQCHSLETAPIVPSTVSSLDDAFYRCTSLNTAVKVPCHISENTSWEECPATVEQYHYTGCGH